MKPETKSHVSKLLTDVSGGGASTTRPNRNNRKASLRAKGVAGVGGGNQGGLPSTEIMSTVRPGCPASTGCPGWNDYRCCSTAWLQQPGYRDATGMGPRPNPPRSGVMSDLCFFFFFYGPSFNMRPCHLGHHTHANCIQTCARKL